MPYSMTTVTDVELVDDIYLARTDGLKEAASTQGHGILVVTAAQLATLVATGLWTDVTPPGST